MRLRHPAVPKGTAIGVREAARKYGVSWTLIGRWAALDKGAVLKPAAFKGDSVLIDEAWLQGRLRDYEPHRDNSARRRSLGRTLVEVRPLVAPSSPVMTNGHGVGLPLSSPQRVLITRPARAATPPNQGGAPIISSREWIERFYQEKARTKGGEIRPQTRETYDYTFYGPKLRVLENGRRRFEAFVGTFPTLPMEDPNALPGEASEARRQIQEWLHALRNARTGGEMAPRSKQQILHNLSTFYNWLKKNKGFKATAPDLTGLDLPVAAKVEAAFTQEEIRSLLALCRTHDEITIITLFAQVGCREGELCSLNPDHPGREKRTDQLCACCGPDRKRDAAMLTPGARGGGWVHAWGKPTKANENGKRVLYLPEESFAALRTHLALYQRMSWRAEPATEVRLRGFIRWICKQAGMYQPGKNTHAFRRAFEAEFLRNGGSELVMDELLGHRKVDMRSLYFNMPREDALEQAIKYTPRRFLQPEFPEIQGER